MDSSLTDLQKQLDSELLKNSVTATDLLVMAKSALADLQAMLDKSMDPRSFGLIEYALTWDLVHRLILRSVLQHTVTRDIYERDYKLYLHYCLRL